VKRHLRRLANRLLPLRLFFDRLLHSPFFNGADTRLFKSRSLLSGFGVVTSRAFSMYYQQWRWLLYLPMLTSRQPCCRNFNWFGS
jgi:hypothetical protein